MVRDLAIGPYLRVKQRRTVNTKDQTMNTQQQFKTPTPAEVQKIVQQAHRTRSEYLSQKIKAAVSNLRGALASKRPSSVATS